MRGPDQSGIGPPPAAPPPGGPNPVVRALAVSLARYRWALAGASAVLLVLALRPGNRPEPAAAGKPGGSSGFTVIDPTEGRNKGTPRRNRPAPVAETTSETVAARPAPRSRPGATPR